MTRSPQGTQVGLLRLRAGDGLRPVRRQAYQRAQAIPRRRRRPRREHDHASSRSSPLRRPGG